MAFTKTPMADTEQTKSVPLLYQWDTRNSSNTYDTDALNVIFEPVGQEYFHAIKRDGLEQFTLTPAPVGAIFATYFWKLPSPGGTILIVLATDGVYQYNIDSGAQTQFTAFPFVATDLITSFTEFLYDNGTVEVFFVVANILYRTIANAATTQVGAAPGLLLPYVVFLDGFLFVAKEDGSIFNSALNDPLTWPASGVIVAESYADRQLAIARAGSYIVSFGLDSIQYFFNAANPTGTPLGAYIGATKRIGFFGGLAPFGDTIYFLGQATNAPPSLYKVDGLKVEKIQSFPATRKMLDLKHVAGQSETEGFIIAMNGHSFYVWRNFSSLGAQSNNNVYAYDLDTGMWTRMAFGATNTFPIKTAVLAEPTTGLFSYISFRTEKVLYRFQPTIYRDAGVNFTVSFQTKNYDFGTYRNKFGSRLLIQGDQTPTTSLGFVSWSDNDYQSFSTPRSIDMSSAYQQLYSLGSFRKRTFKFTYADNFPMRWISIEFDYDQGDA